MNTYLFKINNQFNSCCAISLEEAKKVIPFGVKFKQLDAGFPEDLPDDFNPPEEWFDTGVGEKIVDSATAFENAKKQKLNELETAFFNSKKISLIQHNITLVVQQKEDRKIFFNKIIGFDKIDKLDTGLVSYAQIQNGVQYKFSCLPYIWNFIFQDLFICQRPSGYNDDLRSHNAIKKQGFANKINNQISSIEGLNELVFDFVNPNGIEININEKAVALLNAINLDTSLTEAKKIELVNAINNIKDENGNFNLITAL